MKNILRGLFWVLLLAVCVGATNHQHTHHPKHKEEDVVVIDGKTFSLVVDDYDNWYIKQPIAKEFIYIPAPEFTTVYEDEEQ